MSDELVYDVEWYAPGWEGLDESDREYLRKRNGDQLLRDGKGDYDVDRYCAERLGLESGMQRIASIAMLHLGTGNEQMLCGPDEVAILRNFWGVVSRLGWPSRLITFNGRMADGPVLHIRSAQLGIECTRNLVPYRYDMSDHCDLAEALNFQGSVRSNYSLDYWCRRFCIPSPKGGGVDGSKVQALADAGEWKTIGEYCLDDVRATAALYRKLCDSYLHIFKGGPAVPR